MEKEKQPSYYMVIPASVWNDDGLTANAKLLYGHISTLTQKSGECWASNDYFCKVMDIEERSIQRLLDILLDRKHILRSLITEENVSKRIIKISQPMSPGDDIRVTGADDVRVTHNTTRVNKTSKTAAPRKKTIDPQHAQAAAEHELDTLFRWERIIKIWRTEEDSTFQRRAAKKHFWPMDGNIQEEIVNFIESLGTDVKFLRKAWIGPMLKDGLFTIENIKQEIEKNKTFEKPQTGKFKNPSFFGNE